MELEAMGSSTSSNVSRSTKKTLEDVYQKKTQLEHILLRPDSYIGSVQPVTKTMWLYNKDRNVMEQREITFVPGLYKIFDEILVNAADNKIRDSSMSTIRIDIDKENGKIGIYNDGKGVPVAIHNKEKIYIPSLIFGHLLTSSNYDDDEKKVTGGRNGFGAKLCNIFSREFQVETSSKEYHKKFHQRWMNNMSECDEPKILSSTGTDFTRVSFCPDFTKFGMAGLDQDTVDLFSRRAYDVAGTAHGVRVYLNGERLPIRSFQDYINLFNDKELDEMEEGDTKGSIKPLYSKLNDRWEMGFMLSGSGYQHVGFVNSISTPLGGRHVDYITEKLVNHCIDLLKKKKTTVKPFQVKNHMRIFVNCLIENPTFDSQTKDMMTLPPKKFGSTASLKDDFLRTFSKSGIVDVINDWAAYSQRIKLEKKGGGTKSSKIKGVPKLDDANDAGTKSSVDCTLIVTEGDSAKALAICGLGVIGRDKYGVFPLKGKMLNVREASTKQVLENNENFKFYRFTNKLVENHITNYRESYKPILNPIYKHNNLFGGNRNLIWELYFKSLFDKQTDEKPTTNNRQLTHEPTSTIVTTDEQTTFLTTDQPTTLVTTDQPTTIVTTDEQTTIVTTDEQTTLLTTDQPTTLVTTDEQTSIVTTDQPTTIVTTDESTTEVPSECEIIQVVDDREEVTVWKKPLNVSYQYLPNIIYTEEGLLGMPMGNGQLMLLNKELFDIDLNTTKFRDHDCNFYGCDDCTIRENESPFYQYITLSNFSSTSKIVPTTPTDVKIVSFDKRNETDQYYVHIISGLLANGTIVTWPGYYCYSWVLSSIHWFFDENLENVWSYATNVTPKDENNECRWDVVPVQ
ncbi:hypothetical protein SNEBB_004294 [Seison nebaliae]|nr:hypothetical protein SNEBB_004294 [Seison nebaliae]